MRTLAFVFILLLFIRFVLECVSQHFQPSPNMHSIVGQEEAERDLTFLLSFSLFKLSRCCSFKTISELC
ncbi:hypothetical protein GLYMA_18G218850v4 [Glycine max]|nr:hypothetical protein GLYMA_18G218850v4 [Glycine max]